MIYKDFEAPYISDKDIKHEIGHLVLHQRIYRELKIKTLAHFRNFLNEVPGKHYGFLETQANKFAGYFLVPRNILRKERLLILEEYKEIAGFDTKQLNGYIANPLSKKFGVSAETMEICLNSEN